MLFWRCFTSFVFSFKMLLMFDMLKMLLKNDGFKNIVEMILKSCKKKQNFNDRISLRPQKLILTLYCAINAFI